MTAHVEPTGVPSKAPASVRGAVRTTGDLPPPSRSVHVMNDDDEAKGIAGLTARLVVRFPLLSARAVQEVVSSVHQSFDDARVRGFVPLLVEHDAVIRLKELCGQADHSRAAPPEER